MIPAYATTTDLAADPWNISPAPTNTGALLRAAARLIRAATRTAIYTTTPDGTPAHPAIAAAFRNASCAQTAAWITAGIDPTQPTSASAGRVAASKSLGSGSVAYADTTLILAEREQLRTSLTADAYGILADAGLVQQRPWVTG